MKARIINIISPLIRVWESDKYTMLHVDFYVSKGGKVLNESTVAKIRTFYKSYLQTMGSPKEKFEINRHIILLRFFTKDTQLFTDNIIKVVLDKKNWF